VVFVSSLHFVLLVYAWGTGTKGELGTGLLETQLDPVILEGLKGKNIVQVSCGEYHSLAVSGPLSFNLT
jgi:alpha-tubulin suppressor-like RCC1 family protein